MVTGSLYNSIGGPYHSVKSTSEAINRAGYPITVLGTRDSKNQDLHPRHYLDKSSNSSVIALTKIGPYNWHFSPNILGLWRLVRKADLISIQGVWMLNCIIVAWMARIARKPYYVTVRGEFSSPSELQRIHKKVMKPIVLNLFKGARFIQVLNVNERVALIEYGYSGKIKLVANGIEARDPSKLLEVRKRQLLYLGRLHPDKGLTQLLEAWVKFGKTDWNLVVAGSGSEDYLCELKKIAGFNDSIRFTGPVFNKEKESLLLESKWLILPSFREGMPMSVLEAISYGTPVIITKECNLGQIVENKAGFEVDPNPEAISSILELVFNLDHKTYTVFRKNAFNLANAEFNWDKVINELLNEL